MSSISRAFTTRRVKQSVDIASANRAKDGGNGLQRSKTTKASPTSVAQISGPVELIHTTNMLSYNAPDIRRTTSHSSTSLKSSDEESEGHRTAASSPPTSPDIDSKDHALKSNGPAPNHLSCYFVAPETTQSKQITTPEVGPVPAIPKRSPSHTKQASFDAAARQRSASSMSNGTERSFSTKASTTFSRSSSSSTAASTMSHNSVGPSPKPLVPAVPPVPHHHKSPPPRPPHPHQEQHQTHPKSETHPFGRELAQVTEIAEEFGLEQSVFEEEEQLLKERGLRNHSAETYLDEVQSLFNTFFAKEVPWPRALAPVPSEPDTTAWI